MSDAGIYQIRNTINNHIYIGSSVNIKRRWARHVSELRCNNHKNQKLQRAWNKYGVSAFEFTVLRAVSDFDKLLLHEQELIDALRPFYNISPTAGNRLGCIHLEETRKKISRSHIGIRPSQETIQKLKTSHSGKTATIETKIKMSESSKGLYRGWADKQVLQLSRDKVVINQFKSIMDAERLTGIGNSAIVRCCKGGRPTAGGYIWRYAERGQ